MGKPNRKSPTAPDAEANAAAAQPIQSISSQSKVNLDYPIVQLGPTNYPDFFLGFISYQGAKKYGGADVKFYLQNAGKEPPISEVFSKLDKRWGEDAKIELESKRALKRHQDKVDKHYKGIDEAKAELRRLQVSLRIRKPKSPEAETELSSVSSNAKNDDNTANVTPNKSELPFSMREEIKRHFDAADLDDAQSVR